MPTPQHDSFHFGSTEIAYTVRRSKERKTIGITVCGPMVEVTVPTGMRLSVIRPLVEKKADWIVQKLDLARHHKPIYPAALHSGVAIRLFDRQFQLRIQPTDAKRASLTIRARQFQLRLPPDAAPETGQRLIRENLRKQLESRLPMMLAHYSSVLRVQPPAFQVRELGNRWGSCSPSGKLRFHWLLATQELTFIEQVVAHELCHLIEPRHSERFRKLLGKIAPR
jgi:predicted metal-dependent hydrolase